MNARIDYLSFTFDRGSSLESYFTRLFATVVVDRGRGLYGYRESARVPGGMLAWGGNGNSFYISLSAEGLAWCSRNGLSPRELLGLVLDSGANITRIDVAFDDRSGAFSVNDFLEARRAGEIASRYSTWELHADIDNPDASTVYAGASSSDSRIRLYNKAAEQDVDGPWIRLEWQLRRDQASAVADLLNRGDFSDVAARLRFYCDWKLPASSSEISRWPCHPAWLALLGSVKKALDGVKRAHSSIAQSALWIQRQVAGVLGGLEVVLGREAFLEFLDRAIEARAGSIDDTIRGWGVSDWECGQFDLSAAMA